MITIKKYSNRRLYDTSESQYVTLEELARKIRAGEDVRIIDAKTHEDLTQAVLAQIIIESRGAGRLLPAPMLMQLIRMEDDALAEFFGHYMAWALSIYQKMRKRAARMGPFNPMGSAFGQANPVAQWMTSMYGGRDFSPPPPVFSEHEDLEPPPEPEVREPAPESEDVASLRRELDELKHLMRAALAGREEP